MRVAIYIRVSTEEQANQGYSLMSQEERCRVRASELGASLVSVFSDQKSGSSMERPGLIDLRDAVRNKLIDMLVVYDPDRLARNLSHQLILTEEIEKAGCKLEFINFDWQNTPEGKLFYSMRGAVSEYEREKIKERTQRGKLQKAKQGGIMSVPVNVYGYDYDKKNKMLVINEEEAILVRKIFDLYVNQGYGSQKIAEILSAEGYYAKKNYWHRTTIIRIIKNEIYTGKYHQHRVDTENGKTAHKYYRPKEEWITIDVPAIIQREVWEKAQLLVVQNRKNKCRNVKNEYLLSGILHCGMCGSKMSAGVRAAGGKKYVYYSCEGKRPWHFHPDKKQEKCNSKYKRVIDIDISIWETISEYLANPKSILQELRSRRNNKLDISKLQHEEKQILKRIDEIKKHKLQILRLIGNVISEDEANHILLEDNNKITTLNNQLSEIEGKIRTIKNEENTIAAIEAQAFRIAAQIREAEALVFEDKKKIVNEIVKKVVVESDGSLTIYGHLPQSKENVDKGREALILLA